jgi:glycosyltransferase involved in cell wall biosynthesis
VNSNGVDRTCGGAERYVGELASGMSARGHEVAVLSAFPQREDARVEVRVLHSTDWRDSTLRRLLNRVDDVISPPWPRLDKLLEELKPDLVHTNNLPGIATGIWTVARRANVPAVHTLHDHYLLCPRATLSRRDGSECNPNPLLCGARTRRLLRWRDSLSAVIGPSEYILRAHRELLPGAPQHLVRHPLRPLACRSSKPLTTPPKTLGYIGALTPSKGIAVLLAAAPALAEQGWTVRIAGDGPLRREVETSKHVHYEGWLSEDELATFVGSCDVGLVPSLCREAAGFVAAEWLGGGRPVLATQRGGLGEAGRRGGMVTFDGSAAGLAQAAIRLREPSTWRDLVATLPHVHGDDDVQRWLDEHEAVYEAALGRDRTPSLV